MKVSMPELSKKYGVPLQTLWYNYNHGAYPDKIVTTIPWGRRTKVFLDDEWMAGWIKRYKAGELPAFIKDDKHDD